MGTRNAKLLYGDSRGSSRVTLVEFPIIDNTPEVEAGDLLTVEDSEPKGARKIESGNVQTLFGIAHEDINPNSKGIVEIPFGAVYEIETNESEFMGPPDISRLVHPYGQTVSRNSGGGPMCGILVETGKETGDRIKTLVFGGGISGMSSPIGTIGSV